MTGMRFTTYFVASAAGSLVPTTVGVVAGDALGKDVRLTLVIGGAWVLGLVLSAAFFLWRRSRAAASRSSLPANLEDPTVAFQDSSPPR